MDELLDTQTDGASADLAIGVARWHALWTRSHCEWLVHDQLVARGFHVFLPEIDVWSSRAARRHRVAMPLFPGYVFLRHAIDKASYVEVIKTRGLVRILGEQWDRLHDVPDAEIEAIQRVIQVRAPLLPHPFLRVGRRVCVARGPLVGVEGLLVDEKPDKGLLVLSVNLLRRSIAVEIDCTHVVAA
jgi:transcription termination/antitermination protein NusG